MSPKARHFNGIDGLRTLAIIGVIGFHTRPSLLPGGFVGVTMFFVITGFLITRSLVTATDGADGDAGGFSYGVYLVRRVKRLWPATLATIAVTAPFAYLVAPGLLHKVRADALSQALFAGNWVYIFRKVPYFEAAGLPSPLTHLWFLGVTMQFYLLWPLLMVTLFRVARSRVARSAVIVAVMAASSVAMAMLFDSTNTSRVYYGTDTRLAELATGALVAIWTADASAGAGTGGDAAARANAKGGSGAGVGTGPNGGAIALSIFGVLALAVLLAAFWFADGDAPIMYHGGYLAAAVLSAVALASVVSGGPVWRRVLGCPPLRYLGSRSFALYLMHYPLLEFMNPATRTTPLPWWGWIVQVAIIWAVAEAFHRLVIMPMRPRMVKPATPPVPLPNGTTIPAAPMPPMTTATPRFGRRLRPGAWAMASIGVITVVALTWAPVDWAGITQARSEQLRPELKAKASLTQQLTPKQKANRKSAKQKKQQDDQPKSPQFPAIAEKAPSNLNPDVYAFDPNTGSCNANVLMIGDSVTSGGAFALRDAFPNGFIDGLPNRQMPAAIDVYNQDVAAGHNGDVIIYALGTNGVITDENEVQALVNLAGGKPVYFITIRMPYPGQESNNNAMMRAVAAKNPNVGIIDWHGFSEGHPEYLHDDGIHMSMTGAYAYAQMVRQAVCGR